MGATPRPTDLERLGPWMDEILAIK